MTLGILTLTPVIAQHYDNEHNKMQHNNTQHNETQHERINCKILQAICPEQLNQYVQNCTIYFHFYFQDSNLSKAIIIPKAAPQHSVKRHSGYSHTDL